VRDFRASQRFQAAPSDAVLQSGEKGAVQDVPAERLLRKFPNVLEQDPDKVKAEEKAQNLLSYEVIVAIDPDWTQVPKDDLKLLDAWVRAHKGGLVLVAGPINTYQLARGANQDKRAGRQRLPVGHQDRQGTAPRHQPRYRAGSFASSRSLAITLTASLSLPTAACWPPLARSKTST
jgi:hypothetical protein